MADATSAVSATPAAAEDNKNGNNNIKKRIPWNIETPTPADVPAIVDVQWNAWTSERMQSLFPHTESARVYSERDHLLNVTGQPKRPRPDGEPYKPEPETTIRVVRDASSGKVVAFGLWRHMRPGDDWGWQACWSGFDDIPDIHEDVVEGIFGPSRRVQRLLMDGKEHLMLEALATLDTHRARGIGTALVQWGNAYADARGLPSFLLASPLGKAVYEKVGFAVRDVSHLTDEKPFSVPMVRPGKGEEGEEAKVVV
ncbi:acyl-CoA N-acyltransferase [Apiospora phragmitis]|uniref:Acyl-CoA N-acyltransferase n=1 Tax=Apiospora phragmitis TaxID=2905665 RepID=A0ABR1TB69_9PEZI